MRPFAQTFIGAIVVAVIAGIIVLLIQPHLTETGREGAIQNPSHNTILAPPPHSLQGVSFEDDGSVVWKANTDGIEIEWNPDGSVKRISSKYSVPIAKAGRVGISEAQIVAEERAKAAIVRFMGQTVSSTTVVTTVESDLSRAVLELQGRDGAEGHSINEHALLNALADVTRSYAAGELTGVAILERGYDTNAQMAWVVVGIDESSIRAAHAIHHMTSDDK